MALGFDGTIRIDSSIDAKGFNRGVAALKGALLPLAAALASILGVKAVASIAKLTAEFQRLAIAAQAVGQLFGITAEETRELVGELVAMGIQTDVANKAFINFAREGLDLNLLPALARGAQDLNVFAEAGATSSDVFDRLLNGILTLNPIILRAAGAAVDLDEAYRRFAQAAGTTANALTIQEKRQAALIAVTEKLTGVTGLYELSQQTAAGQLSSHTRIMNEFKAALGAPLQDAFFRLIKGFNDLVKVMTAAIQPGGMLFGLFVNLGAAASVLAQIITGLFGALARLFGVNIASATSTAAAGVDSLAASSSAAADAQDNLADSVADANKAAKGALAAFDELNVLQRPEDVGTAGIEPGAIISPIGEIDPTQFTDPMEAVRQKAEEMKAALLDFFAPLLEAFDKLKDNPLFKTIGDALKWVWENILVPFGEWVIQEFLPVWVELLDQWLIIVDDILTALGPALDWLWTNILKPAAEWIGDILISILEWLTERLKDLHAWIETHQKAWQTIVTILAIVGVVILALTSPIAAVIIAILAIITVIRNWGAIWEWIKTTAKNVWEGIKAVWGKAKDWFKSTVIDPIRDGFEMFLLKLKFGWFVTFEGIKNFIKNIVNTIIDFINGMIAAVISGINAVISALNSIQVSIPDWVPVFGGSTWGMSLPLVPTPQIPRLATGAVIPPNAEFAAILGDQRSGRNLEAPEGLIRQIIQEELGNVQAEVSISFGGSLGALVRELKPFIDKENVRIGGSLIASGVTTR